jgi:hypothetical protein
MFTPTSRSDVCHQIVADASAIGTTVLQIQEIPSRPPKLNGAVCIFNLAEGMSESEVRERLERFGKIESYENGAGKTPSIVHFDTHQAAIAAVSSQSDFTVFCSGVGIQYNERSYNGRMAEEGLEDDTGRGW